MKKNLVIASLCILLITSMIAVVVLYMQRHPSSVPIIHLTMEVSYLDDRAATILSARDKERIDAALTSHSKEITSGKLLLDVNRRGLPGNDSLKPLFQIVLNMHSGWTLQSKFIPTDSPTLARAVINKIHSIAKRYDTLRERYSDKAHTNFTVYDL